MADYTEEHKISMYAAGEYVFDVPPVCTGLWTMCDWIKYIDACKGWRPVKEVL